MRIAVVGAGSIGGYLGGRLAQAGEDVVFIARGNNLATLRQSGLRVDSPNGDFALATVNATDEPAGVGVVDAVLVCVKAWQVPAVAAAIRPLIGDGTAILPVQNGVEAASQLAAVHGDEHVLGGMCRMMSKMAGPGHVTHVAMEPFVALGELDNRRSERVARLVRAFENSGVVVENPADIHATIWSKFLLIASFSGVGAVTRSPAGTLRTTLETRQLLERAITEVSALAAAKGVSLPADAVNRTMDIVDGMPSDGMSSMQRDVLEGRPSELEACNGAVVRLGKTVDVPTPVHEFIYAALLPIEALARREL